MARDMLRHVRSLTQWPVLLGALAAGTLVTASIDFATRSQCMPTGNFISFKPAASFVDRLRVVDWDAPLNGFVARSWAWADVHLWEAAEAQPSALWQTKAGEAIAATPSAQIAGQYGMSALIDVAPLDASFGASIGLRATRFGFPFRTSVRETVWGVLRRKMPDPEHSSSVSPGMLAVCLNSGWAWSPNPSAADRQRAANGGWSQRHWLLPLGVIANTVVFSAAVLLLLAIPLVARHSWRMRKGRCVACGYPLVEIAATHCPECGQTLSA